MRRVRQIIACERFEVRINLDGFGYTLENGTLVVSGTEADESIIAKALDTDLQFSSGSDSFAVPIADVARIEIRALGGTDQIFVESTSGIETSIFGGAGNDVIGFGNTNGNLDTAHGLMHVFGDDGSDNVQCWDNLNPESENFIITNESFTRAGGPEVTYTSDIESLEFMTGLGSDSVNILQLGNLRLRLDSAGGTETVNLGGAFGLSEILNEVVIDNNTSITNVNINDTGNGAPREIIVSTVSGYETIEGLGLGQISVARSNSGAISLTSGLGADVVRIKQTSKTLNINNSAGADTVIIGDDSTPGAGLNNINSDIAVQNFSNLTTLVLTDALSNNAASATWDVDGIDSVVTGLSATGSIRYRMSDIFLATVYASAFNDSFTFNNTTGHLKVLGNNGHDTLTFVGTDATALVEINAGAGNDVLNINADNTGIANVTQLGSDTVQSVAIGTGGKLKLDDAQTALFVNSANINGVLDVGNGAFVRRNFAPNHSYYSDKLKKGYNAGAWNGAQPSILSTSAANAAFVGDSVGFGFGSQIAVTTLDGIAVGPNDLVVRYTLEGDTDLDRDVDFNDLLRVSQNYGLSPRLWWQGNFDYNGPTGFSDLLKLSQNYGRTLPTLILDERTSSTSSAMRSHDDDRLFIVI